MFANKLADLDDFLKPNVECIIPLMPSAKQSPQPQLDLQANDLAPSLTQSSNLFQNAQIQQPGGQKKPDLIKSKGEDKIASVTLQDCLACSGCVTSAETVLIQQHSIEEFLKIPSDYKICIGVSPQSLASLTQRYGEQNDLMTFRKLKHFFETKMGKQIQVYDLSAFNALALHIAYHEFQSRITLSQQDETGWKNGKNGCYQKQCGLPLIASECPGWVCYAEKRCGEIAVPHMSRVKSSQQLFGILTKLTSSTPSKAVCIMPCYDKKLEAVRPDLTESVKEVDTVLATHELQDLFSQFNFDFAQPLTNNYYSDQKNQNDEEMKDEQQQQQLQQQQYQNEQNHSSQTTVIKQFLEMALDPEEILVSTRYGRSSNGYLEYIYRRHAFESYNVSIPWDAPLQYKQGKNRHYQEVSYPGVECKFVMAYGFQHIQNVIRKLKLGKCDYPYVELMACPSGCANGGGQLKSEENSSSSSTPVNGVELTNQVLERLESQESKRQIDQKQLQIDDLVTGVTEELKSKGLKQGQEGQWYECSFYLVDPNDPEQQAIQQATQAVKW